MITVLRNKYIKALRKYRVTNKLMKLLILYTSLFALYVALYGEIILKSLSKLLTSICAPERLARSRQQLERLALARSVFRRFAILKLMKRKSSLERSAESKLIPCKEKEGKR